MEMDEPRGYDLTRQAAALAALTGTAPSLHNAQPWRLRVSPSQVELLADHSRDVAVVDPAGRQLHLGVGAALFALRLALAGLHHDHLVDLLPEPAEPDLAARLTVVGRRDPSPTERALLAQLRRRRTVRSPFADTPVPVAVQVALTEHAAVEGADLRWLSAPGERRGVGALVAAAERMQQADPDYRAELARWTSTDVLAAGAGVPPAAFGASGLAGHAAPFPLRDFGAGSRTAPGLPSQPLEEWPDVVAVCTRTDRPRDWLVGGQALLRVLLGATAAGLMTSQLNQPIENPALRQQLRDELRLPGWPQVLLRMGYPSGRVPPRPPRRPPADILLP
jgi:hypothetical protein